MKHRKLRGLDLAVSRRVRFASQFCISVGIAACRRGGAVTQIGRPASVRRKSGVKKLAGFHLGRI